MEKEIKKLFFLFTTIIIVLLVYLPSLNREWQFFDERLISNESLFPIPLNITELFEIIRTYAFNYHTDSQNAFFSNIINARYSNALGAIFNILIFYLFKKNAFYYHLFGVLMHLINTAFTWLIFYQLLSFLKLATNRIWIISTLLTLLWALHPTNIEAVQLATNWTMLFNYTFSFAFILYITKKIYKNNFENTSLEIISLTLLYFLSLLINEHNYTLPLILYFISFSFAYNFSRSVLKAFIDSFKICIPFFLGLISFVLYYSLILLPHSLYSEQLTSPLLERVLLITPHIFFHFLKLFIYPVNLSINQSNLVNLSDSIFNPLALFKLIIFLEFLLIPAILFFLNKTSKIKFTFPLIYSFLFSVFPFLHIISPTYCLIAERYCYFPLFVGIFTSVILIHSIRITFEQSPLLNKKLLYSILVIIPILLGIKTVTGLKAWENTYTLYSSALQCKKDNLYKGQIHSILGYYFDSIGERNKMRMFLDKSIKELVGAATELNEKQHRHIQIPQTLRVYGLDPTSLLISSSYTISNIRLNHFNENPDNILRFYEPIIEPNIKYAGCAELDLYAKLLNATKQVDKSQKILEYAWDKYPFSPTIIYTLSNLYLNKNELIKASRIIEFGYNFYPTYKRMLKRMIKLYELKKDTENLAKYEYLLGLRIHSIQGYQKSLQLYLSLNELNKAHKPLIKLLMLDRQNPITLLLLSKYYYLSNEKEKVIPTLTEAYLAAKNLYNYNPLNADIYKSILIGLIKFNLNSNDVVEAKKYTKELEQLIMLMPENKK
ncbi:MAG: hypothetical protein HY094_07980 [Candidatus Melainabacteria bacterium]|nr:hypothetical protein [Candidatus Melainabacteria bacterium]